MVLLRLVYAGELPTPGELVKQLKGEGGGGAGGSGGAGAAAGAAGGGGASAQAAAAPQPAEGAGGGQARAATGAGAASAQRQPAAAPEDAPVVRGQAEPETPANQPATPQPESFQEVVKLASDKRELKLAADLRNTVHLVRFEPGHIEIRPNANAPKDLAGNLGKRLSDWTGRRWVVSLSQEQGEATLFEQEQQRKAEERARLLQHPKVQAVLETFPGAKLINYTGASGPAAETAAPGGPGGEHDGEPPAEAPDDGLEQADDPDAAADGADIDPNDPRFQ
jgi:DNA polymerase-3 subunit gamma/tau